VAAVTTPDGATTRTTHDSAHRPLTITDPPWRDLRESVASALISLRSLDFSGLTDRARR